MSKNSAVDFARGDRYAVRDLLKRIRAHRLARNWSQSEMAARAGMSRATYQNFEGGFGNPTLENLMRILGILGFSENITELVPEVETVETLEMVARPLRQRARAKARPTAR